MIQQMYKTIKSQAKTIASQAETLANQAETIGFLANKVTSNPPKVNSAPTVNGNVNPIDTKAIAQNIQEENSLARELSSFESTYMKENSAESLVTEPDFNNNPDKGMNSQIKQENYLLATESGDSGGENISSQFEDALNGFRRGRGRPRKNFDVKPPKREGPGRPRKDEGYGWKMVRTENGSDGESNTGEGGRPFQCNHCEYAATQRGALKTHILSVHEKRKPFSCLKCEYSATQKGAIKIHVASVHEKIKPFVCNQCSYATAHKGNLKTHITLRHKGTEDGAVPDGTPLADMAIPDDLEEEIAEEDLQLEDV